MRRQILFLMAAMSLISGSKKDPNQINTEKCNFILLTINPLWKWTGFRKNRFL